MLRRTPRSTRPSPCFPYTTLFRSVATTPQVHFSIVECTTGLLKAENKLAKLVERTEAVRKSLRTSGNHHLRVMPVIITSKTREIGRAHSELQSHMSISYDVFCL